MLCEQAESFNAFVTLKKLRDAAERSDITQVESIAATVTAYLHQCDYLTLRRFIHDLFEKPRSGLFTASVNGFLYLISGLTSLGFSGNSIGVEKINRVILLIFEKSEREGLLLELIRGLSEPTPSIVESRSIILVTLLRSIEYNFDICRNIVNKIFDILGKIPIGYCEQRLIENVAKLQPLLANHLRQYIATIIELDHLKYIAEEDTLLSALIDYRADALSTNSEYTIRAFVKRQLEAHAIFSSLSPMST